MTETKQLKDEELQKVTGGADLPEGVTPKYNPLERVKDSNGWIFEIIEALHWHNNDILYETIIIEIPNGDGGLYKVGDHFRVLESNVQSI